MRHDDVPLCWQEVGGPVCLHGNRLGRPGGLQGNPGTRRVSMRKQGENVGKRLGLRPPEGERVGQREGWREKETDRRETLGQVEIQSLRG